ncbi:hypothetical protein OAO87_02060 [bacterium]|nr:hypothetical protein [bacterium]
MGLGRDAGTLFSQKSSQRLKQLTRASAPASAPARAPRGATASPMEEPEIFTGAQKLLTIARVDAQRLRAASTLTLGARRWRKSALGWHQREA